jgi:VWFA-related protein
VREKKGGLIGNLENGDFQLFEDGKEQKIKYFTREADLPLTIGLLIDISRSQMNLIGIEQQAASQFFGQVLREKDLAFLISFGPDADLLQDYTNSPRLLRKGLDGLKVNTDFGGAINSGPVPTVYQPRGTILYDAVYLAADQQLRGQVGRKALILITDGEDQGSRYKLEQAVEAAQKADAIIYSVYYVDRQFYYDQGGFFGVSDSALRKLSEETGGRVIRVDKKHPLTEGFDEIQKEMRSQYAAAYTPTNGTKDGTFRRIEIRPKNHDYKVQARKGYFAIRQEQ